MLNKSPGNIAASIRAAVAFGRDYPATAEERARLREYAANAKVYKERCAAAISFADVVPEPETLAAPGAGESTGSPAGGLSPVQP